MRVVGARVGAMVLVALFVFGGSDARGAGATYTVVLCDPQNRGLADVETREQRGYVVNRLCAVADGENSLHVSSAYVKADRGNLGQALWRAPSSTGFVGVRLQAKLRRDSGHKSTVFMADSSGRETRRVATGDGNYAPFRGFDWDGGRQAMFIARLRCEDRASCPQSSRAKTWIRNLRLKLADYVDPTASIDGSLTSGGWKRGVHGLGFSGEDAGSGLRRVAVKVNGAELTSVAGSCPGILPGTAYAARLRPCSSDVTNGSVTPDTDSLPFHEGSNSVSVCAYDFPGNAKCETRTVQVDNVAPSLAFTNAQDPEDPELIQAVISDATSGVASGQIYYRAEGASLWQPLDTVVSGGALRARVDSTAVPAGTYEFRAVANDVAGNQTQTTRRLDGLEKRLAFPLKSGVDLNAHLEPGGSKRLTIRYGKRSKVAGVLRAAGGAPLAGREVVIVEDFGDGALIRERVSRATTDSSGRWEERLPAGPSRRVVVSYAGDQRYLPAEALGGQLQVRTKATLRASRARVPEGRRVVFRGKLGRLGARIPTGGKLLELQVKDARSYQTVGQGFRSKADGSYRVPYRFGDFYQYDVRFKFRVKVAREADWPYKAPIRSKAERVTVLDR